FERLELGAAFFKSLSALLSEIKPVGCRLPAEQEDMLNRQCIVLALYERFYREGSAAFAYSPLYRPQPKRTVAEMLAIAEDPWIADLGALSGAFFDRYSGLLSRPFTLNPTFDGSRDVGGADADLIVEGCLIDIKATSRPFENVRQLVYQLLGYTLLDYSDQYG